MLNLPPSVRIFLCRDHTDMRKSFDGLFQLARDVIKQNPLSGHLFVFFNKRHDRVKILYWDQDGLAVWAKRLERGTFRVPDVRDDKCEIDRTQLALLLGGVDLASVRRRKRYVHTPVQASIT